MNSKEYNGWTNHETWLAALWADNDMGLYEMFRERADERVDGDKGNANDATYALAQEMEAVFEEGSPAGVTGFYADMLKAAMTDVNWYEIAEHYVNDVIADIPEQVVEVNLGVTA